MPQSICDMKCNEGERMRIRTKERELQHGQVNNQCVFVEMCQEFIFKKLIYREFCFLFVLYNSRKRKFVP